MARDDSPTSATEIAAVSIRSLPEADPRVEPHYSTLSQPDMDTLTKLIERIGYGPVIGGIADIFTQKVGPEASDQLSFYLGAAMAAGERVDDSFPPIG